MDSLKGLRRLRWGILCSSLMLGLSATPAPVLAAAPIHVEVGAMGTDGALWVSTDGGPFQSLGGRLLAAPAIAAVPDPNQVQPAEALYIVTGADHQLWVRGRSFGWRLLSNQRTYCIDNPAALVFKGKPDLHLVVACEGSDHTLWWAMSGALTYGAPPPQVGGWTGVGGALMAGPAATLLDSLGSGINSLTFFVLGTDQHIYTESPFSNSNQGFVRTGWRCSGHPAAAAYLGGTSEYAGFACQGIDGQLWFASNDNNSGWMNTRSLGGRLVDGPGLALQPGQGEVFAEGRDQSVWRFSFNGTVWNRVGGVVQHGVGSAALLNFGATP